MESRNIEEKIIQIIRSIIGKSDINTMINANTLLFQAGLDFSSIDGVMLVVKIEEVFHVNWPDELLNFSDILSVRELVEIVSSILKEEEKYAL